MVRQEDRDLTARQLAMFLTCYGETGPLTVGGLAEKLGTHQMAVSRAFDRLEEAGLLLRKTDPNDRRHVLATLVTRSSAN